MSGPAVPAVPGDRPDQALLPGVRIVVARARWIALGALVGLLLGVVATVVRPPHYESTAYLSVSSPTQQGSESMARAAQALARIATAPSVVSGPLHAAGLTAAAGNPRTSILAQAAPDAPLLSVTGTSSDPDRAQQITSVTVQALTGIRTLGPFRAVIVAAAPRPSAPVTPRWVAPVGGTLGGVALAFVLAATVPSRRRPGQASTD